MKAWKQTKIIQQKHKNETTEKDNNSISANVESSDFDSPSKNPTGILPSDWSWKG